MKISIYWFLPSVFLPLVIFYAIGYNYGFSNGYRDGEINEAYKWEVSSRNKPYLHQGKSGLVYGVKLVMESE